MLPIPFEKFIPSFFNRDSKLQALSDKIDQNLNEWKEDILNLNTIIDPVRIPNILLNDIGDYLNAGLLGTDSDRIKRQKITGAIESHKFRGTWKFDVKPTIDAIIGGDSQIITGVGDSSDFIILAKESSDPDFYWGTVGIDGIDDELGVDIVGDGTEVVLAGVIIIDIGLNINRYVQKVTSDGRNKITSDGKNKVTFTNYTTEEIENLKTALEDSIPDYFLVYLGYTDPGGTFRFFDNGQIN